MCERYTLRNVGAKPLTVSVPEFSQVVTTDPAKGVTGSYVVRGDIAGSGTFTLAAGDSLAFDAVFQAYPGGGEPLHPDVAAEFAARMAFVRECIDANLVLETPDSVIDTQFRYAKLRPRAATCTPPAANPTMRPSGPTTRPNTSTPSSPFWATGWAMPRRSIRSAISPAS